MKRLTLIVLAALALLLSACDAPLGTPPAGSAFVGGPAVSQNSH